jgi:hypothetical protein
MIAAADFLRQFFPIFGLAGCLVILLATVPAATVYRGKQAEHYSPLNHYISELGEKGVSRLAPLFNIGLILSGGLYVPFMIGLGLSLGGIWASLGALAGTWAGVSCALVGIHPMNDLEPHGRAAMSFFRGGLVTVLLFTISLLLGSAEKTGFPGWVNIVGITAILSYALFIGIVSRPRPADAEKPQPLDNQVVDRPRFWLIPAVEWLVFLSTLGWFLSVSLAQL